MCKNEQFFNKNINELINIKMNNYENANNITKYFNNVYKCDTFIAFVGKINDFNKMKYYLIYQKPYKREITINDLKIIIYRVSKINIKPSLNPILFPMLVKGCLIHFKQNINKINTNINNDNNLILTKLHTTLNTYLNGNYLIAQNPVNISAKYIQHFCSFTLNNNQYVALRL